MLSEYYCARQFRNTFMSHYRPPYCRWYRQTGGGCPLLTESLPLEGWEGGMTEERPPQMLSGAHSKKKFHSKGKKRTNFVLLGLGYEKLLFHVCTKLSSHAYRPGGLPTSMYSDYFDESEHTDVKKGAWSNDPYDQRTLSSCRRTNLNVGSTWSTAMMDM